MTKAQPVTGCTRKYIPKEKNANVLSQEKTIDIIWYIIYEKTQEVMTMNKKN